MNYIGMIEMELVSSEVTLVRAALRLRAREVPPDVAQVHERIADQMYPIGLYQFKPMEAAYICLALKDFSDISAAIGMSELAMRAKDLSDDFLRVLWPSPWRNTAAFCCRRTNRGENV